MKKTFISNGQKVIKNKYYKPDRKLRIHWNSNAVFCHSGYGCQSNLIVYGLLKAGFPIAHTAFYGLQGFPVVLDGLKIYPVIADTWGSDSMLLHSKDWNADINISYQDVWPLNDGMMQKVKNWIPLAMIDSEPVNPGILQRLRLAWKILVPAHFAQDQLAKRSYNSTLIHHGVDTDIYKPMDKKECLKTFGLPEGRFIFGSVAANKDNPPRKSFQEMFDAFIEFKKIHPEAAIFMQTQMGNPAGFPIKEYIKYIGIQDDVFFVDDYSSRFKLDSLSMAKLFNCFDCLLMPSQSEGFGLPLIEAQSCFVAGTKFSTDTLEEWMQRKYSGELITVKTDKGSIECTPEHPFFTNKGWVRAKDLTDEYRLMYNSNYDKEGIFRGNIEQYPRIVENPHNERGGEINGNTIQLSNVDNPKQEIKKTIFNEVDNEKSSLIKRAIGLFSRTDRRRRPSNSEDNEWWEMETNRFGGWRFRKADEIFKGDNNNTFRIYRKKEKWPLFISHNRNIVSAILPNYLAIPDNKKRQDGTSNKVERDTIKSNQIRKDHKRTRRNNKEDKTFEFAKITSIRKRQVRDILVYNTKTRSNTYLANGFLVHNCGVPVLTHNWTTMPETIIEGKTGYSVKTARKRWTNGNNLFAVPDVNDIVAKMHLIYDGDRKQMSKDARDYMLKKYDFTNVLLPQWIEFLEGIEKELQLTENK